MDYEFSYNEDFLIIKLSGTAGVNERLSLKEYLAPYLRCRKVIVDLGGLNDVGEIYIVGTLNTIQKEFQLLGGEVKFCAPSPKLHRYFQENRLDTIFDLGWSIDQIERRFKEKNNEA